MNEQKGTFTGEPLTMTELVAYQEGSVVSKTLIDKKIGTITVFAFAAGQGLSERPLQDGKLHYTPDVTREAGYLPSLNSGSEVDIPLVSGDKVFGVLVVESNRKNAFKQNDFEILTAAATQASIALGRARLLEEERRRADEQRAVLETLGDLSGELELSKLLQAVLERATTLLGVSGGELAIFDEAGMVPLRDRSARMTAYLLALLIIHALSPRMEPIRGTARSAIGARSRAALLVSGQALLRVDQNTSLGLQASPDEIRVEFDSGRVYSISRFPRRFRIFTPFVNAGVEGTEFLVTQGRDQAEIAVYEGRVAAEDRQELELHRRQVHLVPSIDTRRRRRSRS